MCFVRGVSSVCFVRGVSRRVWRRWAGAQNGGVRRQLPQEHMAALPKETGEKAGMSGQGTHR